MTMENLWISKDGSMTLHALLLSIGIPLIAIGYNNYSNLLSFGLVFVSLGCIFGLVTFVATVVPSDDDDDDDDDDLRTDLRHELMTANKIMIEIRSITTKNSTTTEKKENDTNNNNNNNNKDPKSTMQEKSDVREVVKSLNALAMKYNSERNTANKQTKSPPPLSSKQQQQQHKKKKNGYYKKHELELWCQEASYLVLGRYSKYDSAVAAAISLLALVARDEKVRERNIEQADIYGFNIPIRAMRDSLHRTQLCDAPLERQERLAAELQRKGCLYLGAISDGDMDIATKVVDEDGLIAIFEALKWFCKHSHVCNWALWATFILCYDHMGNKAQLVRLGGINAISNILRQMSEELEVSRHAIAILFDLMREVPNSVTDVARIRTIALNAGVHESVAKAMSNNNNSAEIYMMGQQILVGTGYAGNIPDYTGPTPKL